MQWKLQIAVILILGSLSAVLLADMGPNGETAERLMKSRLEEIKKEKSGDVKTGIVKEFYTMSGEKTKALDQVAYTMTYEISPLLQETPPLREINFTVEWRPEPEKNLSQRLRFKGYLSPEK